ncbi:hypothetical protein [Pseudomonas sp. PDM22]|uniref:hypothetical protein n=1 Tax=Pseudomonas sp. PDM22 TaxID=2769287 RepID=UPI00111C7028|nr:hypothetical protein [Pseudomonas sp. PDM22]MBD9514535.1 hypothetical protein [Pseudomonas sp. PDM22]
MKVDRVIFFSFLAMVLLASGQVRASETTNESVGLCRESLEAVSIPFKGPTGISSYRLFNGYPPVGSRETQLDKVLESLSSSVKLLNVSSACFRREMLTSAVLYASGGIRKVMNGELLPVRVIKMEKGYLMIFLYPGYIEQDETGEELAIGIAEYERSGELRRVIERVSSWAGNEGTLLLRESCLYIESISSVDRRAYPDEVTEQGYVISYELMFDISRTMEYLFFDGSASQGGYECPGNSYIRAHGK